MESFTEGNDSALAVMEGGELEGIFVGFGTTVDEEKGIVVIAGDLTEPLSEALLEGIDDGIGVEAELLELGGKGMDIVRVCVSDGDHGMPTIKVEVILTFVIPDFGAQPFDDFKVKEGVDVEQIHRLLLRMGTKVVNFGERRSPRSQG